MHWALGHASLLLHINYVNSNVCGALGAIRLILALHNILYLEYNLYPVIYYYD
jgi:hypothetical protein